MQHASLVQPHSRFCSLHHHARHRMQPYTGLPSSRPQLHKQQKQQLHRRPSSVVAASDNSHAGHAVLHDFCMTIPYGGVAAVAGVLAFAFKAPAIGLQLAAAAAVVGLCSVLSLKAWKAGGASAGYTLASAGTAGWIAYQMWQQVAASVAPVPSGIMFALSAAACTFCLYNVAAGGNPPPSKKKTA